MNCQERALCWLDCNLVSSPEVPQLLPVDIQRQCVPGIGRRRIYGGYDESRELILMSAVQRVKRRDVAVTYAIKTAILHNLHNWHVLRVVIICRSIRDS